MSQSVRQAQPIDVLIGECLKNARRAAEVTQVELAEKLGITFQQIQKYESGTNRLSVARLSDIAFALKCDFQDLLPPRFGKKNF